MLFAVLCVLVVLSAGTEAAKKACYDHMGCFSMEAPWVSARRPVPAPDPPEAVKIRAYFYSREKKDRKYIVQTWPALDLQGAPFNYRKMTYFLIHGYDNTGDQPWLHQMKDAILKKRDANVFISDWGGGSKGVNYFQASGNTRMPGRQFSNLLQFMINHKSLNVTRLHIIGHSLGAQVAGYIGKSIPGIFQITGMDPAQPLFEGDGDITHLTKNDAVFVQIIHADARPYIPDLGFGFMNEIGDVDFYMNSGHGQPGCAFPKVVDIPKIQSFADFIAVPAGLVTQTLLCPHGLSYIFMTEAIANEHCIFWGHNATIKNMLSGVSNGATQGFFSKYLAIADECTKESCSPMGLDTYFWPARGSFVINTRGSSPYCIYESGIVDQHTQLDFSHKVEKAVINFLKVDN